MNLLLRPLPKSSVGSKYVMAVTGLLLIGFVLAHMAGNLLIFAGREALNAYAHALEEKPPLLWTARVVLLAVFVLHIVLGIRLTCDNMRARPIRYVCEDTVEANWASRHMLLTGLVLLAFVVYHLLHFTFGSVHPDFVEGDVYHNVVAGFEVWPVSAFYIAAMIALGFHLYHGTWSMLQTLGLSHPRYNGIRNGLAGVLAVIIVIGNISIPVAVLAGLIH